MASDCPAADTADSPATGPRCAVQAGPSPRCAYCGGTGGRRAYENMHDRLNYVAGQWSFRRCDGCGSVALDPMPRAQDLASYYPSVYSFCPQLGEGSRAKRWLGRLEHRLLYRPWYASDARRIAKGTGYRRGDGKRVLDVGCGQGLRLAALREIGFDVAGTDFQPAVVRYLQEQLAIPAVCCDVAGLGDAFPASSFDVVTAYYLLEHVVDPAEAVRNCLRLAKPGGWLVFAVPLADSFQALVFGGRWCQIREAPRHVTLPSRAAMQSLARACGCDEVHWTADSSFVCAASLALTLLPGATANAAYGGNRIRALAARCLGAVLAAASVPWCWIESGVIRRPACGLFFLRKPEACP